MRAKADKILELCEEGVLNPLEVLKNVLGNYMSADDANDFAESEYDDWLDDEDCGDPAEEDY